MVLSQTASVHRDKETTVIVLSIHRVEQYFLEIRLYFAAHCTVMKLKTSKIPTHNIINSRKIKKKITIEVMFRIFYVTATFYV